MKKTVDQVKATIADEIERTRGECWPSDMLEVLEDGEALAALGITDEDQDSVEDLHYDCAELEKAGCRKEIWPSVVALMDDDTREEVHALLSPCSALEFFEEYRRRHAEKFGEEFKI